MFRSLSKIITKNIKIHLNNDNKYIHNNYMNIFIIGSDLRILPSHWVNICEILTKNHNFIPMDLDQFLNIPLSKCIEYSHILYFCNATMDKIIVPNDLSINVIILQTHRPILYGNISRIFSPYAYCLVNNSIQIQDIHFIPPHSSTFIEFNTNPINQIAIFGSTKSDIYIIKNKIVKTIVNNPNVSYVCNITNDKKSLERLNMYRACIATEINHNYPYIPQECFDILASGSLLIYVNDLTKHYFNQLGFVHGVNYISSTIHELNNDINYVINPINKSTIDQIRKAGYDLLINHHMCSHRANYIWDTLSNKTNHLQISHNRTNGQKYYLSIYPNIGNKSFTHVKFGQELELDKIYCLCLLSRKSSLLEEVERLGLSEKISIVNAYTSDSPCVKTILKENKMYPIYTSNTTQIAVTLGIAYILEDIILNKFTHAMIIEDDVVFVDELLEFASHTLKKNNINTRIDTTKPYNLFLQSNKPEAFYRKNNKNAIIKYHVRYGEPAYITNYQMCELLLKHMFPITSPYDEYKFLVRKRYDVSDYILVPYICRELSKNYHQHINKNTFVTTCGTIQPQNNALILIPENTFYIESVCDNICLEICRNMNKILKIENGQSLNNIMRYNIGGCVNSLCDYIYGSTIMENVLLNKRPFFVISVRGKKSQQILFNKLGINMPIFDFFLITSRYFPHYTSDKYKYCFIYSDAFIKKLPHNSIYINPKIMEPRNLFNIISNSEFVLSDNIIYISIANSYGIRGIYSSISKINKEFELMANDYYSNITDHYIAPKKIGSENTINIDNDSILESIITSIHPQLPISRNVINEIIYISPFTMILHTFFRTIGAYTQIVK